MPPLPLPCIRPGTLITYTVTHTQSTYIVHKHKHILKKGIRHYSVTHKSYRMFDDGDDGHLSVRELSEIVTELGDSLTHSELKQMIRQAK